MLYDNHTASSLQTSTICSKTVFLIKIKECTVENNYFIFLRILESTESFFCHYLGGYNLVRNLLHWSKIWTTKFGIFREINKIMCGLL